MKILLKINHPAHVYFFKNFIKEIKSTEHQIKVLSDPIKIINELLTHFDIDYCSYSTQRKFDFLKAREQFRRDYETLKQAVKMDPDVLSGIGGTSIAHVSKFVDGKSIVFTDSEDALLQNKITFPFADHIYTPKCYKDYIGPKQTSYPGYHELAYLHPNRFNPDPSVLDLLGTEENDKTIILRFIAWKAVHDIGQKGFTRKQKRKIVSKLSEYGKVHITSESELPKEFEKHRLNLPSHRIHDALYYADLYMGDSQTMATEAAVLGTPAIRSNSFAGENDMGNFKELENKYGLLFSTPDSEEAINKALKWIKDPNLKRKWKRRRKKLLVDKIDVTSFLIDTILKEGSN